MDSSASSTRPRVWLDSRRGIVPAASEASQSRKGSGGPRGALRDACRRLRRGGGATRGPRPRTAKRPTEPRSALRGGRQRRPPGRPSPCRSHATRRGRQAASRAGRVVGSARSAYDRVPPALRLSLRRRRAGRGERRSCDLPRRPRPRTRLAQARGTCGAVVDRRARPRGGRDAPARALRALPRRDRPRHPARSPGPRPGRGHRGSGPLPCRPGRARGADRARAEPGLPRRPTPARSARRAHRARRGGAGARAEARRGPADRGCARAGDGGLACALPAPGRPAGPREQLRLPGAQPPRSAPRPAPGARGDRARPRPGRGRALHSRRRGAAGERAPGARALGVRPGAHPPPRPGTGAAASRARRLPGSRRPRAPAPLPARLQDLEPARATPTRRGDPGRARPDRDRPRGAHLRVGHALRRRPERQLPALRPRLGRHRRSRPLLSGLPFDHAPARGLQPRRLRESGHGSADGERAAGARPRAAARHLRARPAPGRARPARRAALVGGSHRGPEPPAARLRAVPRRRPPRPHARVDGGRRSRASTRRAPGRVSSGMTGSLVGRRLVLLVPTLLGVVTLVFAFLHLVPGDPVEIMLGETAAPADVAALRRDLGLDRPLPAQYARFLARGARGDLGKSIAFRTSVTRAVAGRYPATLELAGAAFILALGLALPLGVAAALRPGSAVDRTTRLASLAGACLPGFWLGPLLILLFSLRLGWLPVSGRGGLAHLVLPATTLGLGMLAILVRLVRTSMIVALGEDYVRSARAKGAPEWRVIAVHALRNALLPVTTVAGLQAGALLAGAIITETIFAWPGLGRLLVQAIDARDYPLVQGCVLAIGLTYVAVNTATDLLHRAIDPRLRDAR